MSATTTYDVNLRYLLEDRASGGAKGLDRNLRDAAQSSNMLSSGLARAGTAIAGLFGLREAKKAIIDFNSNMEQSKMAIAGLTGMNMGGEWTDNLERAGQLVKDLKADAAVSLGTTEDMVNMAKMLAQPIGAAQLGMKGLREFSRDTVVAAASMGIATDVAARDIDQALRGQFHSVDQFTGKLLGTKDMGYAGEEGRSRFNALTMAKRAAELRRAFDSPALQAMKKAQGDSFEGATSTLKSNLQDAIGDVGLPLFKQLTAEVKQWNAWIAANGEAIANFGHALSKNLTSAFQYLKSVATFYVQNKDTLISIAKIWAAFKLTSMGAGAIQGAFGSLSALGGQFTSLSGGMTGFLGKLGSATSALAALAVASHAVGTLLGERSVAKEDARAKTMFTLPQVLKDFQALSASKFAAHDLARFSPALAEEQARMRKAMAERLRKAGLAGSRGLEQSEFADSLRADPGLARDYAQRLGLMQTHKKRWWEAAGHVPQGSLITDPNQIAEAFARAIAPHLQGAAKDAMKPIPELPARANSAEKPKVNITIQRIEVASNDPDRFAFAMSEWAKRAAKNPGQARRTFREG